MLPQATLNLRVANLFSLRIHMFILLSAPESQENFSKHKATGTVKIPPSDVTHENLPAILVHTMLADLS
jgi:hypothetical protein